jgi:hypothetical protein
MAKFLLYRLGLSKNPQFTKTLSDVISPYHWSEIERASARRDVSEQARVR